MCRVLVDWKFNPSFTLSSGNILHNTGKLSSLRYRWLFPSKKVFQTVFQTGQPDSELKQNKIIFHLNRDLQVLLTNHGWVLEVTCCLQKPFWRRRECDRERKWLPDCVSQRRKDLCCPVCYDIFRDPVILLCSHSICSLVDSHRVPSW